MNKLMLLGVLIVLVLLSTDGEAATSKPYYRRRRLCYFRRICKYIWWNGDGRFVLCTLTRLSKVLLGC